MYQSSGHEDFWEGLGELVGIGAKLVGDQISKRRRESTEADILAAMAGRHHVLDDPEDCGECAEKRAEMERQAGLI